MTSETERIAICYVKGEVRLEYSPPDGFELEPKVFVDGKDALLKLEEGDRPKIWKYLGVVEKGTHLVGIAFGQISHEKRVEVRGAQIAEVNFVLSDAK